MNRMQERYEALFDLCRKFIEDKKISCPETIWQTDRVTEDIESFVEEICEICGYAYGEKDE